MTRTIELTEADYAAVSSVSRQLRSRYRDYCEFDDIQQELYVFLLKNYRKMQGYREEYADNQEYAHRLVTKSLRNAGEKFCRKEKAAFCGYEVEDEFFYSIPMVADMLQLYFDPEWTAPAMNVTGERSKKPPQEGGNLMAMVADVGKAYEAMPISDQDLLRRVYDGSRPVRDAIALEALSWGITHNAADHRIRRVIGRLRAELGGPRPYQERDE